MLENDEAEIRRGLREFKGQKHKQMKWWLLLGFALTVLCFFSCVMLLPRPVEVIRISVRYDPALVSDAASAAALCKSVGESAAEVNGYYRRAGINTRLEVTCPPFEGNSFYTQVLLTTRLLTGEVFGGE